MAIDVRSFFSTESDLTFEFGSKQEPIVLAWSDSSSWIVLKTSYKELILEPGRRIYKENG